MMRSIWAVSGLALLAGCQAGESDNQAGANVAVPAANEAVPAPVANVADNAAVPAAGAVMNLAPDGLSLVDAASGRSRTIAFGTAQADAIAAFTAAVGAPGDLERNSECGAGPMDMSTLPNGLQVTFMDGKFVGWTAPNVAPNVAVTPLTTASGIGVGSTRAALAAAYAVTIDANSSLGIEFAAGELFGLLESNAPTAKITDLWAGATCIFR